MKIRFQPGGAHEAPAKTTKKRKRRKLPIVICSILAVVALLCGAYMLWEAPPSRQGTGLSTPKPTPNTGDVTPSPGGDDLLDPTPGSAADSGVYTFLIVGMDKVGYNTDTIMVGSIDTVDHSIDVVSVPRDTLVNIPGSVKKVNTLYSANLNSGGNGIDGMLDGFRDLLGFDVDFYAVVDLTAFVELVDAIGGVTYDVPVDMYYYDPTQDLNISIPKGSQWLSGEEALKVVRFRSGYASADIGRIGTQQDFLKSVASQMLTLGNIPNLPKFISIFTEYVDTDLTAANLSYFARQFLLCSGDDINFHTMPGNYADSVRGFSYVSLYLDEWLEMVNDFLNPYSEPVTSANVNILTHHSGVFQSTVGYVSGGENSFLSMSDYLSSIGLGPTTSTPEPSVEPEPPSESTDPGEAGDSDIPTEPTDPTTPVDPGGGSEWIVEP